MPNRFNGDGGEEEDESSEERLERIDADLVNRTKAEVSLTPKKGKREK